MPGIDGSRVQTPDTPDAVPLQSTDLSGLNFFAAPAHAVEDDRLGQLAQSLGAFDSRVQQFGHYWSIAQRVHNSGQSKTDMDAAQGLIASKTPAEWQQAVKDGSLPSFQSPMAQLAVDRTTGQYAAHNLANDLQTKVGTGELKWNDGSAMNYLNDQRAAIVKQNGWDQDSGQMRGFGDAFNTIYQNAQGQIGKAQVADMNEAHNNAAGQQIEMAVDGAFKANMSPTDTWKALDKVRTGLVQTMHFEPKELDPMIFNALNRRAGQNPNWVMGVGQAPHTDVDGKSNVPALFSKGDYAGQVASLAERQQQFNARQDTATQKADINNGISTILSTDPSKLANVPEQIPYYNGVTGEQEHVGKTEAVHAAVAARLDTDNRRVASGQATPQQVQDEQLETFPQAGLRQNQWADTLNNAAEGGANFTSLTDPKKRGGVLQAYQLYQDLRAKNPAYLNTLLSDKARNLFNTAFMQQSIMGRDPTTAMEEASEITTATKDPDEERALQQQKDAIRSAALVGTRGWFDPDVKNPEIAAHALTDAASNLMRLNHMDVKPALAAAAPYVQNAFVNVNGQLIPDLHYLPKDQMKPAAEKYLSDWANGPAKSLGLASSSLSLSPVGTGRYLIVDGASGMPIDHHGLSYVTARDLIQSGRSIQTDAVAAQKKATDTAAAQAAAVNRANTVHRNEPAKSWDDTGVLPGP